MGSSVRESGVSPVLVRASAQGGLGLPLHGLSARGMERRGMHATRGHQG